MVLLRLDSQALSRSRFALSPLAETLGAAIALSRPCTDPWLAPWHARHQAAFQAVLDAAPFARGMVALIGSTKYLPDHVSLPPPDGMRTRLNGELAQMARVLDEAFGESLRLAVEASWERHDLGAWLTGRNWAARTAELFQRVWDTHLAADWPRRRALLQRDVTYRAALLAARRATDEPAQRLGRRGRDPLQ